MEKDMSLVETKKESFFQKIKNWFKKLFGKYEVKDEVFDEFEREPKTFFNDKIEENGDLNKLQYEFSSDLVSKQSIQKVEAVLDSNAPYKEKINEVSQISNKGIDEMIKNYDEKIEDTSKKLLEIEPQIAGVKNKLFQLQNEAETNLLRD